MGQTLPRSLTPTAVLTTGDQHSSTSQPPSGDLSPLSGLWEKEWAVETKPALHKPCTAVNVNKSLLSLTGSFYGKRKLETGLGEDADCQDHGLLERYLAPVVTKLHL